MPKGKNSLSVKNSISIKGARVNNLKNIDLDIPRDKLVVITGLSGSGKSSVAFDTIYAEGNRRYMEGLSSYAQNFLDVSSKPDVDKIENLSPPISIDQKSISRSPRSTVGTLTEIYDYLRILYSKIGRVHCSKCLKVMHRKSNREILKELENLSDKTQVAIMANPKVQEEDPKETMKNIQQLGYARIMIDSKILTVNEAMMKQYPKGEKVSIVIDRFAIDSKNFDEERILDSIETAMKTGGGSMLIMIEGNEKISFNRDFFCSECGVKIGNITPRNFSFNSPEGACEKCSGLGYVLKVNPELVIPNKNLAISEGAIQPWSKSGGKLNGHNNNIEKVKSLARRRRFSINAPVKKLSKIQLQALLYGDEIFEGVVPGLERKYQETKSDYMRSEIEKYMTTHTCDKCGGKKLKEEYLSVLIGGKSVQSKEFIKGRDRGKNINELVSLSVSELRSFFEESDQWEIRKQDEDVLASFSKEIVKRLKALQDVGLEYLNLGRSAQTISGGEAQRIRLATQLNSQLMGIVYVLDEPSIGLHSRDNEKLIKTMKSLQDLGNSLIVVEHDESIIRAADWIIDMGPGAGEEGGVVIFEGEYSKLIKSKCATSQYLLKKKKVSDKKKYRNGTGKAIKILGASENNLRNIDVNIPLGKFVTICGVSGSGKSTLVNDILSKALSRYFFKAKKLPGKHRKIVGLDNIDKVISIDQSPIGRTPRSNAATYTGVFSHIRDLFSETEEAKNRGYTASRFSFNMKGGRCEVCQGEGMKKIEMHLLPDIYTKCESCGGTRYNRKTLEIEYKGFNIAQVLDMDVRFSHKFFSKRKLIAEKLRTMEDVGLGYLKLGQSATNLSGGEAQRIKLATELARKSTGKTLYILDEPTVGLHFDDIKRLLDVLNALVEKGNSVLVVEHNLDMVREADWVIELGPDGGGKGGEVVFEGTPQMLKKNKKTWTAKYL